MKKASESASNDDSSTRWLNYYDQTRDRPPHETLRRAMAAFEEQAGEERAEAPLRAIDLGCGVGRDSIPLLRGGWQVLATDQMDEALTELAAKAAKLGLTHRLQTRRARFEELDDLGEANLVNAGVSLPFCAPQSFDRLWRLITKAIVPGGRFSGHILGPGDDWARREGVTVLGKAKVEALLDGFALEHFHEEEDEGKTANGKTKRWHIFHIVARRAR